MNKPTYASFVFNDVIPNEYSYVPIYVRRGKEHRMRKYPGILFSTLRPEGRELMVKGLIGQEIQDYTFPEFFGSGEMILRFSEFQNQQMPFLFIHISGDNYLSVYNLCLDEQDVFIPVTRIFFNDYLENFELDRNHLTLNFENYTREFTVSLENSMFSLFEGYVENFSRVKSNPQPITTNNTYYYENGVFYGPLNFSHPGVESYSVGENFIVANMGQNTFHLFKIELLDESLNKMVWSKMVIPHQTAPRMPYLSKHEAQFVTLPDYSITDPDDLEKFRESLNF